MKASDISGIETAGAEGSAASVLEAASDVMSACKSRDVLDRGMSAFKRYEVEEACVRLIEEACALMESIGDGDVESTIERHCAVRRMRVQ